MNRIRFMARRRTDGAGQVIDKNPDECFRLPIFTKTIINGDTIDSALVERADGKVFHIQYANSRLKRWLFRHGILTPTTSNSRYWEPAHEPEKRPHR
jgi:hypothetical protein